MNGALKRSGDRFQNNAVSVTGFTGFVIRVKKVCSLKNIGIRVDVALYLCANLENLQFSCLSNT